MDRHVTSVGITAVATSAMERAWSVMSAARWFALLEVAPQAGGAGHAGLATEPAQDDDLASHGVHSVGEGRQPLKSLSQPLIEGHHFNEERRDLGIDAVGVLRHADAEVAAPERTERGHELVTIQGSARGLNV